MRALSGAKQPEKAADAIIWHPSVRTMLLTQKAVAEGGRSMVYECAKLADRMVARERAGDAAGARALDERLAFLTPILKGFLTEAGKEAADLGIQVYGGHGYIKENKAEQVRNDVSHQDLVSYQLESNAETAAAEQVYRDVRIAPVWEGTTQIQALDLLGRKVLRQKLTPIQEHCRGLFAQCRPHLFSGDGTLRAHAWSLLGHALEVANERNSSASEM